jgi:hypothetical protein
MRVIPLPWLLLSVTVLVGSAGIVGYQQGSRHKADQILAQQARDAAILETAMQGAAEAIAQIEVKNVTIRQKAETITREVPVYRDCRHDPDGLQLVNEALTGKPAGTGKLPASDATAG